MSINESAGDGAVALLAEVDVCLDKLATAPLWPLTDRQALALVRDVQVAKAKLAAVELAAVREIDVRGSALATGASSTAAWLRGTCKLRFGVAKKTVALARAVVERYPATGAGLAAGAVSVEAAHVVVDALDDLPDTVDDPTMAAAEADLLDQATRFDPKDLAIIGRGLRYVLDPDGATDLAAEEARQHAGRDLQLNRDDRGAWHLRGRLDPDAGNELAAAIDVLSRPRPSNELGPDPRTAGQRRADVLADLVVLGVASDQLPSQGGLRPTVVIQVAYQSLLDGLGPAATLADGTPISPAAARKAACDGGILPMVMGTDSQPLDVGRTLRLPPTYLRLAVLVRDRHRCATPGCAGTPREIHHIAHWIRDHGPTELDNLVALCGHCHRQQHIRDPAWTITAVRGGRPLFTPNGPAP
jgi:hypothetical protein